jgi:hypothetical protein
MAVPDHDTSPQGHGKPMDNDADKKALEGLQARLKAEMEAQAREERREAIQGEVIAAVEHLIRHVEQMERDLKWVLAFPRGYRALRERFARWVPNRRTRKLLTASAQTVTIVGGLVGIAHKLYGWPELLDWLTKILGL